VVTSKDEFEIFDVSKALPKTWYYVIPTTMEGIAEVGEYVSKWGWKIYGTGMTGQVVKQSKLANAPVFPLMFVLIGRDRKDGEIVKPEGPPPLYKA
jgi:hypothetical protein